MGRVELAAPSLLRYEVASAVIQGRRHERVSDEEAERILASIEGLGVSLRPVTWQQSLPQALRFRRSA